MRHSPFGGLGPNLEEHRFIVEANVPFGDRYVRGPGPNLEMMITNPLLAVIKCDEFCFFDFSRDPVELWPRLYVL